MTAKEYLSQAFWVDVYDWLFRAPAFDVPKVLRQDHGVDYERRRAVGDVAIAHLGGAEVDGRENPGDFLQGEERGLRIRYRPERSPHPRFGPRRIWTRRPSFHPPGGLEQFLPVR